MDINECEMIFSQYRIQHKDGGLISIGFTP